MPATTGMRPSAGRYEAQPQRWSPVAGPSATEAAALMAKVHSVSSKAEALLATAGWLGTGRLRGHQVSRQRSAYGAERLVDLTDNLSKLEILLDEVASALGSPKVATALGSLKEASACGTPKATPIRATAVHASNGVEAKAAATQRGSSSVPVPPMAAIALPWANTRPAGGSFSGAPGSGSTPSHTLFGAAGHFQDVGSPVGPPAAATSRGTFGYAAMTPLSGRHGVVGGTTPPAPLPPPAVLAGSYTSAVPGPGPAVGNAVRRSATPAPPGGSHNVASPGAFSACGGGGCCGYGGAASSASGALQHGAASVRATPPFLGDWFAGAGACGACGAGGRASLGTPWQRGHNTPMPSRPPSVTPRAVGVATPCVAFGTPVGQLLFGQEMAAAARTASVPRRAPSLPPGGVVVVMTPPHGALGLPVATVAGLTPPAGLWLHGVGYIKDQPAVEIEQDGAEWKIREWLRSIPIGNGAERGWDDSQIRAIASFAQEEDLDHLDAAEIYKRYVEHQVEVAIAED